jgi:hypothetical protein
LAPLTIALFWAYPTGQWLTEQKPIPIKNHGPKAKSVFCDGFDHLHPILFNLEQYEVSFCQILQFLSRT